MTDQIEIAAMAGGLAEDKDFARELRLNRVVPAIRRGDSVVLDFSAVRFVTQSFVHALISHPLVEGGVDVLDQIEFRACSAQVRKVVELVVDYSLGGFEQPVENLGAPVRGTGSEDNDG